MANRKLADYSYFDLQAVGTWTEFRNEEQVAGSDELLYEIYSPDGIHIWYCRTQLARSKTMVIENRSPIIQLHYEFSTASVYQLAPGEAGFTVFPNGRLNLMYLPQGKFSVEVPAAEKLEIFNCDLTPDFFLRYLPEQHPVRAKWQDYTQRAKAGILLPSFPAIQPQVRQILSDLLNCRLNPEFKQLYLKAKMLELITLQFGQVNPLPEQHTLRPEEVQRMEEVRDLILKSPQEFLQVADLARRVGTNETYLKKQFKLLYGCTISQYSMKVRMERARDLLKQGMAIAQVAGLSGYKHTSHFNHAFKKYFGFTPGQF